MSDIVLLLSVWLYLLLSLAIWVYASKRVKTENDYVLAWRGLPMYILIATVFATWFWSETILWTSSTFIDEWIVWIIGDPFGAAICLILVWLFFAKPLYKMGITTLWDFYKIKYWRTTEMLASICILLSYIWWIAAQIVALWIVFNVLSWWSISIFLWSWIWATIVLIYTFLWWMWWIALNDFIQMIMIIVWLIISSFFIIWWFWDIWWVINHAIVNSKFDFFPGWFSFLALSWIIFWFLTMRLWSIPQQDVFQRVLSSKNEKIAKWGTIIWGGMYLIIAFIPIILWYSVFVLHPELLTRFTYDTQLVLPTLILEQTPIIIQILFFWALIRAIMSTASATLLAPSTLFTHNILKHFLKIDNDKQFLKLIRFVVFICFIIVMWFVTYKFNNEDAKIFEMVEDSYKITLAWAFIPIIMGLICKKTHSISWILSVIFWVWVWLVVENISPDWVIPPHFIWMFASFIGFFIWQFLSKFYLAIDEK